MSNTLRRTLAGVLLAAQLLPLPLALAPLAVGPAGAQTAPPSPPASPPAGVAINNPPLAPHQILVFPSRSFVSTSGFDPNDVVRVDVIHRFTGNVISSQDMIPQDDPATPVFDGVVDINHPGGGCWLTNTPDIRAGDRVRTTALNTVTGAVVIDETTVQDVTVHFATTRAPDGTSLPPGTVQVRGTAQDFNTPGTPLNVTTFEQRLLIPGDAFDLNGRRTLRATAAAGNDGTLAYDAPGSINWTATYTGLNAADVARALGADPRIMWLGAGAGVEATIIEQGAGILRGPVPPCTAKLEVLPPPPGSELIPPTTPTLQSATVLGANTVELKWTAATDNVGVVSYGILRNGSPLVNVDAAFTTYRDLNVPPGTYTYTVDAADAVGNRSSQSNALSARVTAQPAGNLAVNEPPVAPIQLITFPSRDFVSTSGFLATDTVTVQIIRNGNIISTSSGLIPRDDPASPVFDGIVEVNHPGGGCWEGVTPDLRAGDKLRTIAYNPDSTIRTVDQTTVANIVVQRPTIKDAQGNPLPAGTVLVHGTAMDADGNGIPAGPITQRLVAGRQLFDFNARRTLRAGGAGTDGSFAYDADDPTGTHWTATYSGLTAADVDRALAADTRILWLGATPLAATEITIYENADAIANGPSLGCTAAEEPLDVTPPSSPVLTAAKSGTTDVQLTWTAAIDDFYVNSYAIYRDGVRIRNVGSKTLSFIDHVVPPGPHTYTVDAADTASPGPLGNAQGQPWGNRSAPSNPIRLDIADSAAPSVPLNLVATVTGTTALLTWSASVDDVGVTGYGVYRGGVKIADVTASDSPSYANSGLATGSYTYTVDAVDGAGNRSAQSAAATAQVTAVADTTAPTTPTGVKASADPRGKDVTVAWGPSTDNIGVTSYRIYRNGTRLADVGGATLTYVDAKLAAGTYRYTVDAADSAGNRSAQSGPSALAAVANEPPILPHFVLVFPTRDFVSASGYTVTEGPVTVSVIRNGITVATSEPITPQDDPATPTFDGIVDVNHPGGGCWTGITPDIRPGDIVRLTTAAGVPDQTTTANVIALRAIQTGPDTIQVHGTAQDALGKPLPADSLRQRIVSVGGLFDVNGRRVLQASIGGQAAGDDGSLAYDAPGSINWTATYSLLSAADVQRALDADSRIIWLGTNPLGFVENTLFENGTGVVGGPAAPCTAPAEATAVASLAPAALTFADQQVGSTSASKGVTLTNTGTLPLHVSSISLSNLNPADFGIASNTCGPLPFTEAPGATCSVGVAFKPTADGARSAALVFQDDSPGSVQTVPLSGNGTPAPQGAASLTPTSLSFAPQQVGTTSASQSVTLTNTGAGALAVGSITPSGDFLLSGNLCTGKTLTPNQSCVATVAFKPAASGARTGSLSFADSAPNSPQTVALSGNGVVVQLTAPSTPTLAAGSDSGTKGDSITNVNTPTFTGTSTSGTSVNILADGVKVGSGPVTGGAYSIATSVLADGSHAIIAQAVDAAGNVSPSSAALSVTIDTVAPVVTAPVSNLNAGSALKLNAANFANSTIPVTVTWSATDGSGSIASYQLQQKKDTLNNLVTTTGTFTDVSPAPTGTSVTLDLQMGQVLALRPIVLNSYTFQVRACDVAGNCSAFAGAPKFQMLPVDDSLTSPLLNGAGSVGYSGNWSTGAVSGAYNGSVHFTTATGATAKLNNVTFNVTADVAWVSTRGPDRGIATVTVDGVTQTVDLYAPTAQPAQVVFATHGLRGGAQHQVQVTSTGTRNTASIGTRVDLDSFVAIR